MPKVVGPNTISPVFLNDTETGVLPFSNQRVVLDVVSNHHYTYRYSVRTWTATEIKNFCSATLTCSITQKLELYLHKHVCSMHHLISLFLLLKSALNLVLDGNVWSSFTDEVERKRKGVKEAIRDKNWHVVMK